MKKEILSVVLASALLVSSCMTVCAAPMTTVDGHIYDVYEVPEKLIAYPKSFKGSPVEYCGQHYLGGYIIGSVYEYDCNQILAAQMLNGTLERIPVGTIISTSQVNSSDLVGYEAVEIGKVEGGRLWQISRDTLLEGIEKYGIQDAATFVRNMATPFASIEMSDLGLEEDPTRPYIHNVDSFGSEKASEMRPYFKPAFFKSNEPTEVIVLDF